jgi:hypothetical protein
VPLPDGVKFLLRWSQILILAVALGVVAAVIVH